MSSLPLPIAAFVAGVGSFLSPRVLPLVPRYVSLISLVGGEGLEAQETQVVRKVVLDSIRRDPGLCRGARFRIQGHSAARRLFAGTGGALPADFAGYPALSQVLQPFPFAYARGGSGQRRVADRAGRSAGVRTLHHHFQLSVFPESICAVMGVFRET